MTSQYLKALFISAIFISCNSGKSNSTNERQSLKMVEIRAEFLYENNRYQELIPILDSLIVLDSLNGKYYYQRGYSFGMLLNRSAAKSDYLKSASLGHRVADSYYNAGVNCLFDNDSLALFYFRRTLEKDPTYQKAHFEIEQCKKRLGEKSDNSSL